jgi:hypothetical protein
VFTWISYITRAATNGLLEYVKANRMGAKMHIGDALDESNVGTLAVGALKAHFFSESPGGHRSHWEPLVK